MLENPSKHYIRQESRFQFSTVLKLPVLAGQDTATAGWQGRIVRNKPFMSVYILKITAHWRKEKIGSICYCFQLDKYQVLTGSHNSKEKQKKI